MQKRLLKLHIVTTKGYKITYNLDGGTLPTDAVKEFTDGSKVELPIPFTFITSSNCIYWPISFLKVTIELYNNFKLK